MKKSQDIEHDVILFDGVCNLCNAFVSFVIDRDPKGRFLFAPLQSKYAQDTLHEHKLDCDSFSTIVLIQKNHILLKSSAVLNIAKHLKWPWPLVAVFLIIPKLLRNWGYHLVSQNRYRWFGKLNECRLPTPELQSRFLS